MAFSFIQQSSLATTGSSAAGSLSTSAMSSSVTAGDLIVVCVVGTGGATATTLAISDSESNPYTCAYFASANGTVTADPATTNIPAGQKFVGVWYAPNVAGGSSFTTQVMLGASSYGMTMVAAEFSAPSSVVLDGTPVNANGSTGGSPAAGIFSASANDLILLAFCAAAGSSNGVITQPSGYTLSNLNRAALLSGADGNDGGMAFFIPSSAQSSVNPTWATTKLGAWVAIAVALESSATVPSAPAAPTVSLITDSSATFTWVAPSNGGAAITDYILRTSANGGGAWSQDDTMSTSLSFRPTDFGMGAAGSSMLVEVAAVNSVGQGAWSPSLSFNLAGNAYQGLISSQAVRQSYTW
jgi:Fibronectin type III domain